MRWSHKEFLTDIHRSTLKMIKEVEEIGGSAEYVRSLTDTNVPEIPKYSDWPSTRCSITSFQIGPIFNCSIAAPALYVGTKIRSYFPVVPTTPDATLRVDPGTRLEGQRCRWFVAPQEQSFILCFHVGGTPIAIVEGPGDVEPRSGGANEVVWV